MRGVGDEGMRTNIKGGAGDDSRFLLVFVRVRIRTEMVSVSPKGSGVFAIPETESHRHPHDEEEKQRFPSDDFREFFLLVLKLLLHLFANSCTKYDLICRGKKQVVDKFNPRRR